MAKQGNLFALTSPSGEEVGIFHQLGSTNRSRVCIQNCLVEKFGKGNVTVGKGIYMVGRKSSQYLTLTSNPKSKGIGYFLTPDGPYMVETITPANLRYNTSAVIKEYSDFFGRKTVKAIINDVPVRVAKKEAKEYVAHKGAVAKMVSFLDDLMSELGYTKNVQPLRFAHAAKRKK